VTPRVPPLPRERWDDAVEAALRAGVPGEVGDRFMSTGPDAMRVPNGLTSVMYHPALAGPFLAYNAVLLREQQLTHRQRELIVLRVAWRTRSPYEWVQHVRLARRYTVTDAELEAIGGGADGGHPWEPLEADLLRATDEAMDHYRVSDATWARLAEHLDEAELVEVLYVIGTYTCLAMVFNSLGIELDPELDPTSGPALPARDVLDHKGATS
jgi:4-carboxymuconolactone decarboxylase